MQAFWLIFMSLMLSVQVCILPTYEVAANAMTPVIWLARQVGLDAVIDLNIKVSLLNSYSGLILPLIASATGTFFCSASSLSRCRMS